MSQQYREFARDLSDEQRRSLYAQKPESDFPLTTEAEGRKVFAKAVCADRSRPLKRSKIHELTERYGVATLDWKPSRGIKFRFEDKPEDFKAALARVVEKYGVDDPSDASAALRSYELQQVHF